MHQDAVVGAVDQYEHDVVAVFAPVGEQTRTARLGRQDFQVPSPEHRMIAAQRRQALKVAKVRRVLVEGAVRVPVAARKHRLACLHETLFGALVDDGNARDGEHDGQRLPARRRGRRREEPRGVVVVDEIGDYERIRVGSHERRQPIGESRGLHPFRQDPADAVVERVAQHGIGPESAIGLEVARDLAFPGIVVGVGNGGHFAEGQEVVLAQLLGMGVDAVVVAQETVPERERHQHDGVHPEGVDAELVDPVLVDLLERRDHPWVLGVDVPERVVVLLVRVGEVLYARRPVVDVRPGVLGIQPVDQVERVLGRPGLMGVPFQEAEVLGGVLRVVFAVVDEEVADVVGDDVLDQVHPPAMQFVGQPLVVLHRPGNQGFSHQQAEWHSPLPSSKVRGMNTIAAYCPLGLRP